MIYYSPIIAALVTLLATAALLLSKFGRKVPGVHWPGWFPLLVFSPFIADASVTLLKRTLRGVKFTEAHREHYYQRLVQIGWGHRNVAFFAYALMFAAGVSAIFGVFQQHSAAPWILCMAWGGAYALLMLLLDSRWKAFQRRQHG